MSRNSVADMTRDRRGGRMIVPPKLIATQVSAASIATIVMRMITIGDQGMTYDFRAAAEDKSIRDLVLTLAKRLLGPMGKKWGERAVIDSTERLVFTDDNGRMPARGIGREATIADLLKKRKDMPRDLPRFLEELDDLLRSKDYDSDRISNISIAWKGKSGVDEEWLVNVPRANSRHNKV